jgi:uncharacterized membrane protein YhiD involved in acid resistance
MLQDFQNFLITSITIDQVLINVGVALACGIIIALFYRAIYKGPGYQASFVNSMISLSMITAVVIMVIGNNLARAFGLVGAMSIIRFRTAIKDTQDIVFIFFSLAVGMAAGVGLHRVALSGTLFICLVLLVLSRTHFAVPKGRNFLLQFTYFSEITVEAPYLPVLRKYCRKQKLINVKSNGDGTSFELSYYIDLRNNNQNHEFVRELGRVDGVSGVNLFYDEEQF